VAFVKVSTVQKANTNHATQLAYKLSL